MSKPWKHAISSVEQFGGSVKDYLPIHQLMDSSKGALGDNRHRALTHNSWFIGPDGPLEKAFGVIIHNSDGDEVCVRDIAEQHILEDFGGKFIPTAQDYLRNMTHQSWMSDKGETTPDNPNKVAWIRGINSFSQEIYTDPPKVTYMNPMVSD